MAFLNKCLSLWSYFKSRVGRTMALFNILVWCTQLLAVLRNRSRAKK